MSPRASLAPVQVLSGHFRLFCDLREQPARMSWRLLANNHREMGRGARTFDTARECWDDVDQLLSVHEDLKPRFSSLDERWQWRLLRPDGVAVATSGHGFDRRLRCERGLAAFTAILHTASSGPSNAP